jgi:asparagine synthase (glutamine-hydrolysing)
VTEFSLREAPRGEAKAFLGHRRLSIIDLGGTRQPLRNEDGTVWTVFNGEIYNYHEIISGLAKKGHIPREKGDTEAIVHLWEEYGDRTPLFLRGMFSLAVYDTRTDTLFLCRDRFGKKPLYYWRTDKFLAFASELQALKRIEGFPASEINLAAAAKFFKYGYIPGPDTIYKNVFSLPAGHSMTVKNGLDVAVKKYWAPHVAGEIDNPSLDDLENRLDEAVRIRLKADVPSGVFLSGGIDSSLVTASMVRTAGAKVKSFTISTGGSCDESEAAAITAAHLGTEHTTFTVEPDFVAVSEKLAPHFGQPFADYSSVPSYYVSRETRRRVTVALGGDGGDELFAGYNRYLYAPLHKAAGRIPRPVSHLLRKALSLSGKPAAGAVTDLLLSAGDVRRKGECMATCFHRAAADIFFTPELKKAAAEAGETDLCVFQRYYDEAASSNPMEKWLEADQRMYLCDDILVKVDITSMAVSLECRAPFLDHKFAEHANKITLRHKLRKGRTKHLLRLLAEKRLPPKLAGLPKKGFTIPLARWMRGDIKDWCAALLFDRGSGWDGLLQKAPVTKMWNEHISGARNHDFRLWMIISYALWSKYAGK